MTHGKPAFPFFLRTEPRPLSSEEHSVLERLLAAQAPEYRRQLATLTVVGRCGCGVCPTVFFLAHEPGDSERDIVAYTGKDVTGGIVAAVLLVKQGLLSQLEFYSVDGHDPWHVPKASSLEPYR